MSIALPQLISVRRIWDSAPHNAFTDLLYFQGKWLCAFRESATHGNKEDGVIRIIESADGEVWSSVATLKKTGSDLRDPKLSVMPDGRLMLVLGRTLRDETGRWLGFDTCTSFSVEGHYWTPLTEVLQLGDWLWRVTWDGDVGYGIAYSYSVPEDTAQPWLVRLYSTTDGLQYTLKATLDVPGYPSEATLRFDASGQMLALVRRESLIDSGAWLGRSMPPYSTWSWQPLGAHLDGPDFVVASDGMLWAAGRVYDNTREDKPLVTALCRITKSGALPLVILPSGGDNSYPGMELQDKILWMSYYSSHEHKTAIYLAKIQLP